MEHSFDVSSCNNPDCGKHHMKIHRWYKCCHCGNILHPAPLGCLQAVNDNGVIECLPGKGCNSHAGLPSISASVTGSSLLQQSALHFQPTRPSASRHTANSEDDEDAKMPAATLPAMLMRRDNKHSRQELQALWILRLFHFRLMQKWMKCLTLLSGVCFMKRRMSYPKIRGSGKPAPSKQIGKRNTPSLHLWLLQAYWWSQY